MKRVLNILYDLFLIALACAVVAGIAYGGALLVDQPVSVPGA